MLGALTLGPEHKGALVPCVSCGHLVRSRSLACPLCGAKNPGKARPLPRRTLALGALVVIGVIAIGGWSLHAGLTSESQAAPAPVEVVQEKPAELISAARVPEPAIRPVVVSAVAPAPVPAVKADSLQTRWTSLWANVREEPQESALVLDQLPPGTMVEGVRQRSGWWRVYLYGDSIGYVAGALLQKQPPDSSAAPN